MKGEVINKIIIILGLYLMLVHGYDVNKHQCIYVKAPSIDHLGNGGKSSGTMSYPRQHDKWQLSNHSDRDIPSLVTPQPYIDLFISHPLSMKIWHVAAIPVNVGGFTCMLKYCRFPIVVVSVII